MVPVNDTFIGGDSGILLAGVGKVVSWSCLQLRPRHLNSAVWAWGLFFGLCSELLVSQHGDYSSGSFALLESNLSVATNGRHFCSPVSQYGELTM